MGVRLSAMDDDLAGYFRAKADEGALILGVDQDSPAMKAGLKSGDVIVRIGKDKVYAPGDVVDLIQDCKPGDRIEVAALRKGVETVAAVELGENTRKPFIGFFDPSLRFEWNADGDTVFFDGFHGKPFSKERWEQLSKDAGERMKEMEIRKREIIEKSREKLENP